MNSLSDTSRDRCVYSSVAGRSAQLWSHRQVYMARCRGYNRHFLSLAKIIGLRMALKVYIRGSHGSTLSRRTECSASRILLDQLLPVRYPVSEEDER